MGEEKREWWTVAAYRGVNLRWTRSYQSLDDGQVMYRNVVGFVKTTGFDRIYLQHVSITRGQAPDMTIIEEWEPESAELSP